MNCSLHRWEIAASSLWLNDTLIPHLITTEGISPLTNLDKNLNFMILNANLDVNSSTRQAFKTNRANHIIFVYTTLMLQQVSSSKGCQFKHLAAKTTKEGGMITWYVFKIHKLFQASVVGNTIFFIINISVAEISQFHKIFAKITF